MKEDAFRKSTSSSPNIQSEMENTQTAGPPGPVVSSRDIESGHGTLAVAETVGRYAVLSHLGSGGMGSVYAAYDPDLDRKVALKLVRPDRAGPDEATRLLREARAQAKLTHPNVVRVYDVGLHEEQLFFAMEFVSDSNLRQWIAHQNPDWRRVVRIFSDVAQGLAAAHESGLVHRDLKPENILIGKDGEARIADFGLVRSLNAPESPADQSHRSTNTASPADRQNSGAMGTRPYMAPELSSGGTADELSDQYSFFVALHLALYREFPQPHSGNPPGPKPSSPSPRRIKAPSRLRRIVLRGLSRNPRNRYPTMRQVLTELSRVANRKRHSWVGASALAGTAALLGTVFFNAPGATVCGGSEERFVQVWDEGRKKSVRSAFLRSGSPFAGDVAGRIESALNRYRSDWVSLHRDTCFAASVRGELPERIFDLRMLCLENRREEVRALTDLFIAKGDAILPQAVEATQNLASLKDCEDRSELAFLRPLPMAPEARQRIKDVQARLAAMKVRRETGQETDLEAVRAAVRKAQDIGYSPLTSTASKELALTLRDPKGDVEEAIEQFEAFLKAAIAGGDSVASAEAYAYLASTVGYNKGDIARGEWWSQLAEAALEGLGPGHETSKMIIHRAVGLVAWHAGRHEKAQDHWFKAVDYSIKAYGPQHYHSAQAIGNLALLPTISREDQIEYLHRALDLKEKALGEWNPQLANSLVNLGAQLGEEGRYEEGLKTARRCAEILIRFYGSRHQNLVYPWLLESELLIRMDLPEQALASLTLAEGVAKRLSPNHRLRFHLRRDQGNAKLLMLDLEQAESFYRQAGELLEDYPPRHPLRYRLAMRRGQLALIGGRPQVASRVLEEALELFGEVKQSDWDEALLYTHLGEALRQQGRVAEAIGFLERAAVGAEAIPYTPTLQAVARFALARALASSDPARSQQLALLAQQGLAAARSPLSRRFRAEVQDWIEATQAPSRLPGSGDPIIPAGAIPSEQPRGSRGNALGAAGQPSAKSPRGGLP